MKNTVIALSFILLSFINVHAQTDTLYIFKGGNMIYKRAVVDIDSIIFYKADLPQVGSLMDIDGNIYKTVIINNQEWMAENLRTTRYSNEHPIPRGLTNSQWLNTEQGAYSVYPHSSVAGINSSNEMIAAYGLLYNWYAAVDERNICPIGWRVPSDDDWTILRNYILSQNPNNLGDQLKACRQVNSIWGGDCNTTGHPRWDSHHTHYGTDLYEFAGFPGGYRSLNGIYDYIGTYAYWWATTEFSETYVRYRRLRHNEGIIHRGYYSKNSGFNIRCVRDNHQ